MDKTFNIGITKCKKILRFRNRIELETFLSRYKYLFTVSWKTDDMMLTIWDRKDFNTVEHLFVKELKIYKLPIADAYDFKGCL